MRYLVPSTTYPMPSAVWSHGKDAPSLRAECSQRSADSLVVTLSEEDDPSPLGIVKHVLNCVQRVYGGGVNDAHRSGYTSKRPRHRVLHRRVQGLLILLDRYIPCAHVEQGLAV